MADCHVLYRFYSATGQLLYVGITMRPPERFKSHRDTKRWWSEVSGITVENYSNRVELERAERRAIQVERPQYNVVHNGKRQPAGPPGQSTDYNPTGIVDYDVDKFATVPTWQKLAQLLNQFAFECQEYQVESSQDELADAMGHLARAIGFLDCCSECERDQLSAEPEEWNDTSTAPFKTEIDGGSMFGRYRCAWGHEWICRYNLMSPVMI